MDYKGQNTQLTTELHVCFMLVGSYAVCADVSGTFLGGFNNTPNA